MLFNTYKFAIFFACIFFLYILLRRSRKSQNVLLLFASYYFYGSWNWKFLWLIIFSTLLDYVCGLGMHNTDNQRKRKLYLTASIVGNLGVLAFFKYYNFFAGNVYQILHPFISSLQESHLDVILPVGISFYTFQTMSYTIDIYRKQINPTRNILDFAVYVSFFPQLVAGPIERASRLLPQIEKPREMRWDKFKLGSHLIFWGLFKKLFVADNLAPLVNSIFDMSRVTSPSSLEVLLALYAFSFQIYCDFSGYSDIARGLGKCLGIELMENFRLPYFATSPKDLWRRWHISLSIWLRDYLYISLGGSKKGKVRTYISLVLTMLLGGLWHGASWMFVLWGAYHGLLLVIHRLFLRIIPRKNNKDKSGKENILWKMVRIIFMFHLTTFSWLLFRAQTVGQFVTMCSSLFSPNWYLTSLSRRMLIQLAFFTSILIITELIFFIKKDTEWITSRSLHIRAIFYSICFALLLFYSSGGGKEFIYFQF
jgi:alginate O-acetyltransferase complex protein AlgI